MAAFTAACLQTHLASRQEERVTIVMIIIIMIVSDMKGYYLSESIA
jgi:hypothetical protein